MSIFHFQIIHFQLNRNSLGSHLLDNLDVGRFGTTYTVLNAFNGEVLVNSTQFLGDFHATYNLELHVARKCPISTVRENSQVNPTL